MTIELTRQLLERYLRATGHAEIWDEYAHTGLSGSEIAADIADANTAGVDDDMAFAFRLGLCAAAERLLDTACRCYPPETAADRERYARLVQSATLRSEAYELLRAAGITPEAWEAAR